MRVQTKMEVPIQRSTRRTSRTLSWPWNSIDYSVRTMENMCRLKWPRIESLSSRISSSISKCKLSCSHTSRDKRKFRMPILNNTKILISIGILNCKRHRRKTSAKLKLLSKLTLRPLKRTVSTLNSNFQLPSNSLQSFWTCARSKPIWLSRKITRKLIKFSSAPMKWRNRNVKGILRIATKRFWQLKQSWCRNNRMKWTHWERNLKDEWMKDLSYVRLNITKSSKVTRTLRRVSKISRL